MTIVNLVETTCLIRYLWLVEITFDQGSGFISHEFNNISREEEYGIKPNPDSSGNQRGNTIIEKIHQVLGNLVHVYNIQETYANDSYP